MTTPRSLYQQQCIAHQCHCNTGVLAMLPDDEGCFGKILSLDLSRNCVGRNGILPVLEVVRRCTNLKVLQLENNYLSNESVKHVCGALAVHQQLVSVILSRNPISHAGGKILSQFALSKPSLRYIGLEGTLMNPGLSKMIKRRVGASSSGGGDGAEDDDDVPLRKILRYGDATSAVVMSVDATILQQQQQRDADSSSGTAASGGGGASPLSGACPGLRILSDVSDETRHRREVNQLVQPADDWYAMETIWNLASVAAPPPQEGWAGLASVMALVRQDISLASMYQQHNSNSNGNGSKASVTTAAAAAAAATPQSEKRGHQQHASAMDAAAARENKNAAT